MSNLPIPENFTQRTIEMYDEAGQAWIEALPSTLANYAQRWSLTLQQPFELSYNYVIPAIRADGSEAVLKLGFPHRELLSEMHALQHFDGRGIVRMLEADFEQQVFLLERIRPGVELVTLQDEEQVARIVAQVMQQLWQPVNIDRPLLTVESWTASLAKLRPHFEGTSGPFPEYLKAVLIEVCHRPDHGFESPSHVDGTLVDDQVRPVAFPLLIYVRILTGCNGQVPDHGQPDTVFSLVSL